MVHLSLDDFNHNSSLGLKIQKEKLLEARKIEKEENELTRLKHEKDVKELEKVRLYIDFDQYSIVDI